MIAGTEGRGTLGNCGEGKFKEEFSTKLMDKTKWDRDMKIREMPKKSYVRDLDRFFYMCGHAEHPIHSNRRGEIITALEKQEGCTEKIAPNTGELAGKI